MKSHKLTNLTIAGAVLAVLTLTPFALAEAKKAKFTVKEVMQEIHKGNDNIGKRALGGKASNEDLLKMVEYYASLPLNDPPRGDKAAWLQKTAALVKASEELKAGKADAMQHYKDAANCKACHNAHKPEEKK